MNQPDWRGLALEEGTLLETPSEGGRLVVWVPTDRDSRFQHWERITSVPRADVTTDQGLCATAATSIRVRQWLGGFVGQFVHRLRQPKRSHDLLLPNGASAEQCGQRQTDLVLVWPAEQGEVLDEPRLKSRWPDATRFQRLGQSLFVVSGLGSPVSGREVTSEQPPPTDSPRAHAEALLAAARQSGSRDKEATALTDLGVISLNEGDAKAAIAFLEEALTIAREIGDLARESDVAGNLGMAMLTVRQPERARALFQRDLAHARSAGDRFAEKVALERLGLSSWNLRDFAGALTLFDAALDLARQLGDRLHEANLLWHQGIQHAELGEREPAIARAEEAVALFRTLGRPQAASYGAYLQKYRMGLFDDPAASTMGVSVAHSPHSYLGGSVVAGVMASQSEAEPNSAKQQTGGPGLLRMALSATKAMAGFAGSGFKTASAELQKKRLQTCASCEHHTGVRCKICGCFTSAKSRLLHEDCPIGKWPD